MIRITKGPAPATLVNTGRRHRDRHCAEYLGHQADYNSGTKVFKFNLIYNSDAVWEALNRDQKGKCCFTEAKFTADYSHVEHFRPKGRVDDWPGGEEHYPGYYWLAYEWSNLFLCKSYTNSSMKRNFFPLAALNVRNRNHLDRRQENAILINPETEDPRKHIRFSKEEIKGITRRGKKSIKILDLRFSQLDEARRTRYTLLDTIKKSTERLIAVANPEDDALIAENIQLLRTSMLPEAEFSSMAIDLLTGWPHL